jgi:hypothetical protein
MSFEKEIENVGTWIQKHAKFLVVLAFAYLIVGSPIGLTIVQKMGIVNPGFPGAEVATVGVNFKDFGSDWQGTNMIHLANNSETTLVSHSAAFSSDRVYWGDTSPVSLTVVHDFSSSNPTKQNQLETDVQSPIPLADYNYQNSTPLAISTALSWDQGEVLPYWNPTGIVSNVTQTLPNGTQINTVTYSGTMQSLLLIPGNFFLSLNIPSGRYDASTDSGWQEGSWSSVDFWYEVYWYNWLNAYAPLLQQNAGTPPVPNTRAGQFNLVGGFPIQGWIQQYTSPMNGVDISQIIVGNKDGTTSNLTATGVSLTTLANIEAQISLSPQYAGQSVVLYTEANDSYVLPTPNLPIGNIDAQAQGLMHSPDIQTVLPAEFFKIHINNIGTFVDGNIFSGWTVYYPAVSYIVRFIFAVYGEQPFVWTVQTALNLGYNATANYQVPPAQWQPKQIVTTTQAGLLTGLTDWFSNPLNDIQFWLMIAVIVFLLITVLNPGVWTVVLGRKKED